MTADFDQDPNHITPGGTKSNESFTSSQKGMIRHEDMQNNENLNNAPLMPPEESFKKKKYKGIPMRQSEEQKQAIKMQIRKKLLSLTN